MTNGLEKLTGAPLQPMRRAHDRAEVMTRTLKRILKADERPAYEVMVVAGLASNVVYKWPKHSLPTLTSAMALADAVGYEIVLRRKE